MRNLTFILALFVALSCTKDDEPRNTVDPIVGIWSTNFVETDEDDDGQIINIPVTGTLVFNENGTGLLNWLYIYEGDSIRDAYPISWSNLSLNPDYNVLNQAYTIDGDLFDALYAPDFKSVLLSERGYDFEFTMTRD